MNASRPTTGSINAATPGSVAERDRLERRTQEIGRDMLRRARAAEPPIFSVDFWSNWLQDWATADPRRRVQLFQFVDVFPTLKTDADIVAHLNAYLGPQAGKRNHGDGVNGRSAAMLPLPANMLLRTATSNPLLRGQLAALTRREVGRMARRFIAGENPEQAIATVQQLRHRKMGFTVDILGEATLSESEGEEYARKCRNLLSALARAAAGWPHVEQIDGPADKPIARVNLSLKLTSLSPHFDPINPQRAIDAVLERLRPIARLARRAGAFINVDMEQYQYKDLTLEVFKHLCCEPEFRDWSDVGIVLQAYLRDASDDLEELLSWVHKRGAPISVRLVKGAYWDYEAVQAIQRGWPIPVLTQKWQSDAQFESLSRKLIDNRTLTRPALASHNVRSLAAALGYAEAVGAGPHEFELQMLFGMGDPLKRAVADMGYNLRIYTPCGPMIPGMAYLIRRLLENTSNESFVKATFSHSEPPEVLLADPAEVRRRSAPLPEPVAVDPEEPADMNVFELEPMADFSRQEARQAMSRALQQVRGNFGRVYPLVIDGKSVETGVFLDSINPSEVDQVVGRVHLAETEHVQLAVAAARKAFEAGWSRMSAANRAELLNRLADLMHERRYELAGWMVYESGKPWKEADADVCEAIDFSRFYGREMMRLEQRPRRRDVPGQENLYFYEPKGVVAVIAPWNFPLAILTGMSTAALAAGNTVVIKPAEQSPVIAAKLMEMVAQAGFPPGVVNYLPGSGETVGAALVEHVDVDVIAFTGSREVGMLIHERAGKWRPGQRGLKRVIAEMGGKNAIIVDADADLDEAVAGVVVSTFGYAGQKCSACSRAIVHRDVREQFLSRLVEAARAAVVGPAENPDTQIGPVIDEESRQRVLNYIERGTQEGKLVYLGDVGPWESRGYYVPPAIFDQVPSQARIAQEEIFGPVLAVLEAGSFDEALQIANGTPYALTGGVYSRHPEHVQRAKREFKVGNLYINQRITGALVDRQPFGGLRMSGIGTKTGGPDYLLQFLEPRAVTENTLRHGFTPDSVLAAE